MRVKYPVYLTNPQHGYETVHIDYEVILPMIESGRPILPGNLCKDIDCQACASRY